MKYLNEYVVKTLKMGRKITRKYTAYTEKERINLAYWSERTIYAQNDDSENLIKTIEHLKHLLKNVPGAIIQQVISKFGKALFKLNFQASNLLNIMNALIAKIRARDISEMKNKTVYSLIEGGVYELRTVKDIIHSNIIILRNLTFIRYLYDEIPGVPLHVVNDVELIMDDDDIRIYHIKDNRGLVKYISSFA